MNAHPTTKSPPKSKRGNAQGPDRVVKDFERPIPAIWRHIEDPLDPIHQAPILVNTTGDFSELVGSQAHLLDAEDSPVGQLPDRSAPGEAVPPTGPLRSVGVRVGCAQQGVANTGRYVACSRGGREHMKSTCPDQASCGKRNQYDQLEPLQQRRQEPVQRGAGVPCDDDDRPSASVRPLSQADMQAILIHLSDPDRLLADTGADRPARGGRWPGPAPTRAAGGAALLGSGAAPDCAARRSRMAPSPLDARVCGVPVTGLECVMQWSSYPLAPVAGLCRQRI
jgi:hypothetical protein